MALPIGLLAPWLGGPLALALGGVAHADPGAAAAPGESEDASVAGSAEEATAEPADTAAPEDASPPAPAVAGTPAPEDASPPAPAVVSTPAVSTKRARSGAGAGDGLRGTLGVGAIHTLAGLNGINARYFVLDRLSLGLNVGVGTWTFHEDDPTTMDVCPGADCRLEATRTIATLGVGLEALYFVRLGNPAGQLPFRADFGVGGRFDYFQGFNAADMPNNFDDPTEFDIELPLVVQLRFGDHFTLSPELGLCFIIVPGSREDGDLNRGTSKPDVVIGSSIGGGPYSGPGFGVQITNGIGVLGGASLHYYF